MGEGVERKSEREIKPAVSFLETVASL